MKPSVKTTIIELVEFLRKHGVKEMSYDGFTVKFGPGEVAQTLAQAVELAPPPNQNELVESSKVARDTAFALRAEAELAQLQIDDPDAYEEALLERELDQSEREDENTELLD